MKWPCFSLVMIFMWKCILLDFNNRIPVFYLMFFWYIFSNLLLLTFLEAYILDTFIVTEYSYFKKEIQSVIFAWWRHLLTLYVILFCAFICPIFSDSFSLLHCLLFGLFFLTQFYSLLCEVTHSDATLLVSTPPKRTFVIITVSS